MNRTTPLALGLMLFACAGSAAAQAPQEPAAIRIRYIVNDVTPAVAFYTGKLGFKLEMQSGPYFAVLSRGGVQLLLSPPKGIGGASQPMPNGERPASGGWNRMVIYVTDLPGKVAELRTAGVHFRNEIVNGPGGSEILLEDPSGNPVELFQPH
jgi:catechol 2,3-dioxygenase-like lactoylglutathione lyase family enzyme